MTFKKMLSACFIGRRGRGKRGEVVVVVEVVCCWWLMMNEWLRNVEMPGRVSAFRDCVRGLLCQPQSHPNWNSSTKAARPSLGIFSSLNYCAIIGCCFFGIFWFYLSCTHNSEAWNPLVFELYNYIRSASHIISLPSPSLFVFPDYTSLSAIIYVKSHHHPHSLTHSPVSQKPIHIYLPFPSRSPSRPASHNIYPYIMWLHSNPPSP